MVKFQIWYTFAMLQEQYVLIAIFTIGADGTVAYKKIPNNVEITQF